jgi:hypothetical protein
LFLEHNPNAKLLLHTSWAEGWDIKSMIEEKGIDPNKILTTYFCSKCKQYEIKSFSGQQLNCKFCGSQNSVNTTNIENGVSEKQLNEIYNLMNVYCHPFTSGGQEIPIQEAKLTELITLVTDYSCGEDYCHDNSGGFPLKWSEYREAGTQFIKASTCPIDICDQLLNVFNMSDTMRDSFGKTARQFVIDVCSVESIGRELESIIDNMPDVDYDFNLETSLLNAKFEPNENLPIDSFIIDCYLGFLNEKIDQNSSVFKQWKDVFAKNPNRKVLIDHLKNTANTKLFKPIDFESVLDQDDKGRRLAIVIPQSETDVLLINSLMKNVKKQYPRHNIYIITKPEYFDFIEDNPYIHKCITYSESIDNPFILEGAADHAGYFDLAFFPSVTTQKNITYVHNGKDKIQLSLT